MSRLFPLLHMWSPLLVEFVGTFFLGVVVTLMSHVQIEPGNETRDSLTNIFAPIAVGSVLMSAIFMGGHISGAHYNPAVTLAVYGSGRGKITLRQSLGYLLVQYLAAFLAAFTAYGLCGQPPTPVEPGKRYTNAQAFGAELLFTFLLCSVMLNVATTRSQENNSFFGLAIGFTVTGSHFAVFNISGGVFNPALAAAITFASCMSTGQWHTASHLWLYTLAPMIGANLSWLYFRITNAGEFDQSIKYMEINTL